MKNNEIIFAFRRLGELIKNWLEDETQFPELSEVVEKAVEKNGWFSAENIKKMLFSIVQEMLDAEKLEKWLSAYKIMPTTAKRVGIIAAGNLPMVFFHDFVCVLLSGNIAALKFSGKDKLVPKFIIEKLLKIDKNLSEYVEIIDDIDTDLDVVIATGNTNTALFFEEKFGNIPHIFRKSRTSTAIITGKETENQLELLCNDMFSFFGLGCRNVTKLFVPQNYNFATLIKVSEKFSGISENKMYSDAYKYNKALLKINSRKFMDNKFWLLVENASIFSNISVVYYQEYCNLESVNKQLSDISENLQCIVNSTIDFGKSQMPKLSEYADGVDTMKFLTEQI